MTSDIPEVDVPGPPSHVRDAVEASSTLHAEHAQNATSVTRFMQALKTRLSRPTAVLMLCTFIAAWMVSDLWIARHGGRAVDDFPFPLLGTVMGCTAVLMTLIILATQQHEYELSEKRAKITLELAMINQRKLATAIRLLMELREDLPNVRLREYSHAIEMAEEIEPSALLEELEKSRDDME